MQHNFFGKRILVAEDDYLIAMELANALSLANAQVLGPFSTLEDAARQAQDSQLAILDVDLKGQLVFPLADRLLRDGVSLVFYTGFGRGMLPARFADVPCLNKLQSARETVQVLARSQEGNVESIAGLLPGLRRHARHLIHDARAADRLVELALRKAIDDPNPLPPMPGMKAWLEQIMQETVLRHGGSLLH
jgi:hypothetical protein